MGYRNPSDFFLAYLLYTQLYRNPRSQVTFHWNGDRVWLPPKVESGRQQHQLINKLRHQVIGPRGFSILPQGYASGF